MASTLRVHSLAKELGVPSKAVIEKCKAEGIVLKNHMAALSVGLAESIREWFSVGADVTSIEVADHVDVAKAQRSRRKMRAKAGAEVATVEAPPEEAEAPEAQAPAQAETAAPALITEVSEPAVAIVAPDEPVFAPPAEQPELAEEPAGPVTLEPAAEAPVAPPAEEAAAVEPEAPAEVPVVPPEPPPEPVQPAGPQLVPKPAELKGPQVVRIEAPEQLRPPRPRPRPHPRPAATAAPATGGPVTTSPRRGRGKGGQKGESDAAQRTRSPRRHGTTTDVDQREREWRDQDLIERKERLAGATGRGLQQRRAAERRRQASAHSGLFQAARKEPVAITVPISLKEFSAKTGVPFSMLAKLLMEHTSQLWMINHAIDADQAELLAEDLGIEIEIEKAKTAYERLEEEFESRERNKLKARPPVVAMLGHVDHGKTSLLDAIRKTSVASGEAGGITQHIGAYRIDRGDWHVTFVDTPGHEAFTAMRARGANLTDVVVLVVAVDDGVMPQTVEAINHAKAAGVAIVVALNKSDLPGVNVDRVYGQLAEHELVPSEWGGDTDVIKTSATTGAGIDDLVSHLSTLSELLELQADSSVPAQAMVIEAQMREGRGVVAQVLVREGTLRSGQCIVCGPGSGRIRALRDDRGKQLKQAGPGTPVEISGLDALPGTGDRLYVVKDLSSAKAIAEEVQQRRREDELDKSTKAHSLETLLQTGGESEIPELNVILKADVQGSVEVLKKSLAGFPTDKAQLRVLHAAVGAVSEADVHLAKASGALVVGFHVVAEDRARQLADQLGVEVRTYRVIYEILDDLHKLLAGLLEPEQHEEVRGAAEVRQVFHITRVGMVAGCYVTDGVINRNNRVRLVRDGRVVVEGKPLVSLKRFKDDARDVRAGLECGIRLKDFDDLKPGDVVQAYDVVEVAQEL